ncbi:MAG: DUF1840 domain-containing protein [Candidatus Competibacteraceae bacterium]|nr:MAG: DUF1840 domain-containing protein [Candidatus Competibacteraceae bacterium]
MIVTFRSKAYADIMMFGDIAVRLLKLMGHSGTVPSALLAEDVPAALERLKAAVAANKAAEEAADDVRKDSDAEGEDDEKSDEHSVALAHRALPLIELLAASATAQCDVMWDQ